MKKNFYLFILLLTCVVYSQKKNNGEINGYVLDKKNKLPIPYVSIACKSLNDKIITGGITDEKGKFTIKKLPYDSIKIEVKFIGFKPFSKKIRIQKSAPKINLKKIFLTEDLTHLENIEVRAEDTNIINKIDKKIINVGKDLVAIGGNSLQMLQNVPSIDINLLTGTFSLRGNENVQILINGKPSNMDTTQLLRQIPSSMIKQIEIITAPSAKYNPEGMSGIINFILKKNMKLNLNGTVSFGTEYSKNIRYIGSTNMNYNSGKVNFYGNYNLEVGKYSTIKTLDRIDKNLYQKFGFLDDSSNHSFRIGADFFLNKKNTLSIYTNQNIANSILINKISTSINNSETQAINLNDYIESEQVYNIDYKLIFNDTENLEIEANYAVNKNPQTSINRHMQEPFNQLVSYNNNITDTRKYWLINIDYTTISFNDILLELGLEYRDQETESTIETDQLVEVDTTPISVEKKGNTFFDYTRKMFSGYFNINKEFKNFSFQTGLRLESFIVNGVFYNTQENKESLYTEEIFSLYPSASLIYNLSEKNDIQFAYSRRVDRPSMYQLSPIQEWVSPLTIAEGNQELTPQFTNSYELNFSRNFTKGSYTIGAFYRRIYNKIGRTIDKHPISQDKQIWSFGNYTKADSYGIEFFGSYKITSWWKAFPRIEAYEQNSTGIINGKVEMVTNTLFKAGISNNFKAHKKLKLQLNLNYRGESKNIQFEIEPYTRIDLAASLAVLNKRGTIQARAIDLFNQVNYDFTSTNPFPQRGNLNLEYNQVYLEFTYNFGGSKVKSRERRERDPNETEGGIL